MIPERIEAQVVEHRKIIKALHQYMATQEISRMEWGLIFAKAAGYEINYIVRKNSATPIHAALGADILNMAVQKWAAVDMLNVD